LMLYTMRYSDHATSHSAYPFTVWERRFGPITY
jgi:hypothetical protein